MSALEERNGEDCPAEFVRRQIEQIEAGLQRALAGDFRAIRLDEADPLWGGFAMHVNVIIHATRTALTRAERFEREAAEARRRARSAAGDQPPHSLPRPAASGRPRDFLVDPDDREHR